ncbi:MAG TPA: PEP-CTERM sorting domain-containing protein [Fimbriimonadaceae bacterium]|nr:PEP-CTERM sorting domain-containing protein [Fimbriimonadaceae bacterium]
MYKSLFLATFVTVSVAAQAQVFSQDFESGLGANESVSGNFGINNSNALNNGTLMMGHGQSGYVDDEYSFYEVTLDLSGWSGVSMSFDYLGEFETHFDRFNVLANTGAISPPNDLLMPTLTSNMQFIDLVHDHHPNLGQFAYDSSPDSGGNSGIALFDLSAFDGQMVTLRFQFGSDGSFTDNGFEMDNLVVTAAPVPEPASIAALGLGAVALIRKRRKKAASR